MSVRTRARLIGVVYLLYYLTAMAGEAFTSQAGVSGLQGGVGSEAAGSGLFRRP